MAKSGTSQDTHDESDPKRICSGCIGDAFLKAAIVRTGSEAECSYCGDEDKTITVDEMADWIEKAFEDHYERTARDPEGYEAAMHSDKELDYEWERKGEQAKWAIAGAANIDDEDLVEDIRSVLENRHADRELDEMGEESPFDDDSHYAPKEHGCEEFQQKWNDFEKGLKTEARYFSRSAQAVLEELFSNLPALVVGAGRSVIRKIGPDTNVECLYRARIFPAENEKLKEALKYPWKHLGPPPMQAAVAGRMNARGISVFYSAIEAETALAEVRPPVGSQVAVAKFEVTRTLRLLDLESLKAVTVSGSIFDPDYIGQIRKAIFMEILSARLTRPIMPNEEALEYLATQAVADYLATEIKLDGIMFPSVQVGHESSNVVLFHHASRVEDVELPPGTEIKVYLEEHDDEGTRPNYSVWEEVPPTTPPATPANAFDLYSDAPLGYQNYDIRMPSLRIDTKDVGVHHIEAVRFTASKFPVSRDRIVRTQRNPF